MALTSQTRKSKKRRRKHETPLERTWRIQYQKQNIKKTVSQPEIDNLPTSISSPIEPQEDLEPTSSSGIRNNLYQPPIKLQQVYIVDLEGIQETPHDHFDCQCDMPFRILDLEPEIRTRILGFLLVRNTSVFPFFNFGSVEIHHTLMNVEFDNIDISILLTNKQLSLEATDILYGQNVFEFTLVGVSSWWFKRIGSNVGKVRMAGFHLNSGEFNQLPVMNDKMWLNLFNWLAPRHRLAEIYISFSEWQEFEAYHADAWTSIDYDVAADARARTLDVMESFRGLQCVEIRSGTFLSPDMRRQIMRCMLREKRAHRRGAEGTGRAEAAIRGKKVLHRGAEGM